MWQKYLNKVVSKIIFLLTEVPLPAKPFFLNCCFKCNIKSIGKGLKKNGGKCDHFQSWPQLLGQHRPPFPFLMNKCHFFGPLSQGEQDTAKLGADAKHTCKTKN